MKIITSLYNKRFVFAIAFALGVSTAEATVNLNNVPLQTGSNVDPNIMFIIDDSGSMHFELMPEELRTNSGSSATNNAIGPTYMFPRLNTGIYGGGDNTVNNVPSFRFGDDAINDDERITAALYRSSAHNKIYYNPAVTYLPWPNSTDTGPFVALNGGGNVNPEVAFAHPTRTSKGSRNLKGDVTESASWVVCTSPIAGASGCAVTGVGSRTYFPAVYYHFNGGEVWNKNSYQQVEIRSTTATYSGHGRSARTDCTAGVCTYAQEIQNFANWHTYYRSRLLAAQAGIGRAFAKQNIDMRVGFGAVNQGSTSVDGVNASTIVKGVRQFSGTSRDAFFTELYTRTYPFLGTPLRRALDDAGNYFRRTDSKGPWGLAPGSGSEASSQHLVCRQNFSVLMTDGYWSDGTFNIGNQDGENGVLIKRPSGSTESDFTYTPTGPFADSHADTLADVAMKYWKNDIRTDLENRVPSSDIDPAFWQHMVTFGVSFGMTGSIDKDTAFKAIKPLGQTGDTINWPVPSGFNSSKIDDLLHAAVNSRGDFFSAADPKKFAEGLSVAIEGIVLRVATASNLVGATSSLETNKQVFQGRFSSSGWTGDLWAYSIDKNDTPTWKASEKLNARDWKTRKIIYSKSVGLAKGDNFTPSVTGLTDAQVDYIRGDTSKELQYSGGIFRNRKSILGDIAHSSPFYVGATENKFYERFSEWAAAERTSYSTFLSTNSARTKAVYVGSNSGMLHAFNADNGEELFAYIPNEMLAKLPKITSKDYQHEFFVDGSAVVADAYVSGNWKSVLVGTTGRGGKSVFALDVTRPGSFDKDKVLWEKSIPELGNYTGKPFIAKLRDDKWYAILGSGVNSSNYGASLILLPLDGGAHKVMTAAAGSVTVSNGLFQPEGWDIDNSGRVGRVYAGDYQGNVWEFDLSDVSPSKWNVAYENKPLFTARDKDGNRQAITGGVSVSLDSKTGNLWLFFGTGKYLEKADPTSTETQSWYGLITPVTAENKGKGKGAKLVEEVGPIAGRSDLAKRTLSNVDNARVVEDTESLSGKRGWYIDLIDSGERITSTPKVIGTTLVVNTIVPKTDQCSPEGYGYVMAVDPFEGTRLKRNFFDIDGSKLIDDNDQVTFGGKKVPASGLKFDSAPGEPIFYKDTMKVGLENAAIIDVVVDTETKIGRVSWREVIN
jgi:type IV pilus assembly protein PilY1